MRSMAALGKHLRTRQAASSDRDQGRACSLHPEASQTLGHLWARSKKHGQIHSDAPEKSRPTDQRV